MNTTEMMVICREVDRATGKIAVYRFEAKNRNARGHCTRWRDRPALRGCARW